MSDSHGSPVEQGQSPVAGTVRRQMSIGTRLGIIGLVAVLALGFVWFNALYSHRQKGSATPTQTAYTGGGEQFTQPPPTATKAAPAFLPQPAATSAPALLLGTRTQETPQRPR